MKKLSLVPLLFALALPLAAEPAKMHGVGYRVSGAARACWENFGRPVGCSPIDTSAHPYGPAGGYGRTAPHDPALLVARYCSAKPELCKAGPIGEWNERWQAGYVTLQRMFEAGLLGDPARWDGDPSAEEVHDLAVTTRRGTGVYLTWYWSKGGMGGGPAEPPAPKPPAPQPVPEFPDCPVCPDPAPCPPVACPPPPLPLPCPRGPVPPALTADVLATLQWLGELNGAEYFGAGKRAAVARLKRWAAAYQAWQASPSQPSTGLGYQIDAVDDEGNVRE
jgi:hypothetical protein